MISRCETETRAEADKTVTGNSNITIMLTKKLKEKLDYLSTEYTKSEITGFLTYSEIKQYTDGSIKIIVDDLLIPPQEAQVGEVDIDAQGQVALRNEFPEKFMKIIGKWHSHHTMGCYFSSTDEAMMKSYMDNKTFRVFIVSSEGKHLTRLVVRNTIYDNIVIEFNVENIKLEIETDNSIKTEMDEEIKKKVKIKEFKTITYSYTNTNTRKTVRKEVAQKIKYYQHKNTVAIEKIFLSYANLICKEFAILNPKIEQFISVSTCDVLVEIKDKNKAKEFMCDVKELLVNTIIEERNSTEEQELREEEEAMKAEMASGNLEEFLDEEEMLNYRWSNRQMPFNQGYIGYREFD